MPRERLVKLFVDLTGSNCGDGFLSVNMDLAPPPDWDTDRIRQGAAEHYAVPLEQVGEPHEVEFCNGCGHPKAEDCICWISDEPICDGEFAGPRACVCGHPERHVD